MTNTGQWYVLGVAATIIVALGLWWVATTGQTSAYFLGSYDNASTTEDADIQG